MQPKKILYIDNAKMFGGGPMYLLNLLENLDKNKYHSAVVCSSRNQKFIQELRKRNIKFIPIKAKILILRNKPLKTLFQLPNFLLMVAKIIHIIKREKVDIIQANLFYSALFGSISANISKKPFLWIVHIPSDLQKYRFFSKFIIKLSAKIIPTCNDFIRIAKEDNLAVSKFQTIYAGLNLQNFKGKEEKKLMLDNRGIEKPIVALVARLSLRQKRHQDFIEAAGIVLKKIPQAIFLIVGGASNAGEEKDKERLEKLIKKKRLSQKIIFTGFFPDLNYLLSNIEVLVLPSLQESIPAIILEAMAMRKPVVATDVGGIPEVVVDGETGFLIPVKNPGVLAEKIIFLLKNPEKAKEMGRKGYIRVKKYFSQERMAEEYEKIYKEMLQK